MLYYAIIYVKCLLFPYYTIMLMQQSPTHENISTFNWDLIKGWVFFCHIHTLYIQKLQKHILSYIIIVSISRTPAILSLHVTIFKTDTTFLCYTCSNLWVWPRRSQCLHRHCGKGGELCKSCWFHTVQSLSYMSLCLELWCDLS